jgi:prepilin-type N-terminal cleavage/methylation domain-containing protein
MKIRAFTLLELLTVIAIIALLSAIIFPVYSRAKVSANRGDDISRMNELRSALQLYRVDWGNAPESLLGYVNPYMAGDVGADLVPANQVKGPLYPERVNSIEAFKPAYNDFGPLDVVKAVYPSQDPRAIGDAPVWDTNGDGVISSDDDVAGARQAFGPADGFVQMDGTAGPEETAANYYALSGYDVAVVPDPNGGERAELRYAKFWTSFGLTSGALNDDPRQLGYADPPDETLITWNSYYRDYQDDGTPERTKGDIALFLGGAARPYDSAQLFQRSWRVLP